MPPITKKLPQVSSNGLIPTMKAVRSTSMLNKNGKNGKNGINGMNNSDVQRAKSFCNFENDNEEMNWWHHSIGSVNKMNEQPSEKLKVPQPPPVKLEKEKKVKRTTKRVKKN